MARLLVAGVIAVLGSVFVLRQMVAPNSPSTPGAQNSQIQKAQQNVNQAMDKEMQRAKDLNQKSQ